MSRAFFGQWLREERRARGWSVSQMGDKLRQAAAAVGDDLPARDCLMVMIHRWEDNRSGMSERYRLHFSRLFKISLDQFGQAATSDHQAEPPESGQTPRSPESARVGLTTDVQLAIHAACNQAVRGILADIIGHLGQSLANDLDRLAVAPASGKPNTSSSA